MSTKFFFEICCLDVTKKPFRMSHLKTTQKQHVTGAEIMLQDRYLVQGPGKVRPDKTFFFGPSNTFLSIRYLNLLLTSSLILTGLRKKKFISTNSEWKCSYKPEQIGHGLLWGRARCLCISLREGNKTLQRMHRIQSSRIESCSNLKNKSLLFRSKNLAKKSSLWKAEVVLNILYFTITLWLKLKCWVWNFGNNWLEFFQSICSCK